MLDTEMLIGAKFVAGTEAAEAVINPKTEETIVTLPDASVAQVDAAVNAADKAFQTWSRTTPAERSGAPVEARRRHRQGGRRLRHARGAQLRQAEDPRSAGRDAGGVGLLPLLCRRGAQHARAGGRRVHGRPHLDDPPRSDRRGRLDRAVELSPDDGDLEACAGTRRRQHHRASSLPSRRRSRR